MIDKGVCDKGFNWNPSNWKCKCYKFCDFTDRLDYKKCKCKKRLVNELVEIRSAEECTENIEETRLCQINSTECKHNSSTFSIFFLQLTLELVSIFCIFAGTSKKRCYLC